MPIGFITTFIGMECVPCWIIVLILRAAAHDGQRHLEIDLNRKVERILEHTLVTLYGDAGVFVYGQACVCAHGVGGVCIGLHAVCRIRHWFGLGVCRMCVCVSLVGIRMWCAS